MRPKRVAEYLACLILLPACVSHYQVPADPLAPERGVAPAGFDANQACSDWRLATSELSREERDAALSHVAYPELTGAGCFVPVRYSKGRAERPELRSGCGYPRAPELVTRHLREQAQRFRNQDFGRLKTPFALECSLTDNQRARVAETNANTLDALAVELDAGARYPYAAVAAFGYGSRDHDRSSLNGWLPGDRCPPALGREQNQLLGVNRLRAYRAADAVLAGVAPVAILSGGAVHSTLNESFMLAYLVTCRYGLRGSRVLLDPCAEHTHENVRNAGGLVVRLAGRTAYIVTDDGLQADYLQEWTFFDLIGGSIDQRSLRDFRFLVGSFRQASQHVKAGFWYSPYRFWADPNPRLRNFTCLR